MNGIVTIAAGDVVVPTPGVDGVVAVATVNRIVAVTGIYCVISRTSINSIVCTRRSSIVRSDCRRHENRSDGFISSRTYEI